MSKNKDATAKKTVLDYINKQNRPYSAIDIFNNLHKEYGKTAVVRCLEELAQEGLIIEKVYGKQKVYSPDQTQFPEVNESELKQMDAKITELNETLKTKHDVSRKMENDLRGLNNAVTTEEAVDQLTTVTVQLEKFKSKLQTLKGNENAVSPEDRKIIIAAREKYVKEWKKRKRITNDILGSILEGYPKPKKQLYEDVGIETDEDYKVSPPEL